MKQATKDVMQTLSLPCRRLEFGRSDAEWFGPSDVARASRRAASASGPASARTKSPRLPAVKRPSSTTQQTAIKSPESPPVRLDRRQQNNETCHETTFSDALLPAVGPSPSKKSLKKKTLYADTDHQPPEIAQIADISAKIGHSLPFCNETLYPYQATSFISTV